MQYFSSFTSSLAPFATASNISYALAGIVVLVVLWNWRLERKLKRLLIGKNAHSLEDSIMNITGDLKALRTFTKEMESYLTTVEKRLNQSVQSVETVRYNPFKGTGSGGNNSFSTAFINEKGDGVVLTSMYARDRISMFAKPIKAFASDHEMSEEEQESLEKCKTNLKKQ